MNLDGTVTVRPTGVQRGSTLVLSYEICDSSGSCSQAQITLTVLP